MHCNIVQEFAIDHTKLCVFELRAGNSEDKLELVIKPPVLVCTVSIYLLDGIQFRFQCKCLH